MLFPVLFHGVPLLRIRCNPKKNIAIAGRAVYNYFIIEFVFVFIKGGRL